MMAMVTLELHKSKTALRTMMWEYFLLLQKKTLVQIHQWALKKNTVRFWNLMGPLGITLTLAEGTLGLDNSDLSELLLLENLGADNPTGSNYKVLAGFIYTTWRPAVGTLELDSLGYEISQIWHWMYPESQRQRKIWVQKIQQALE